MSEAGVPPSAQRQRSLGRPFCELHIRRPPVCSSAASGASSAGLALIRFRGRVDYAAGACLRRSNSAGLIWLSVE